MNEDRFFGIQKKLREQCSNTGVNLTLVLEQFKIILEKDLSLGMDDFLDFLYHYTVQGLIKEGQLDKIADVFSLKDKTMVDDYFEFLNICIFEKMKSMVNEAVSDFVDKRTH